ncbi:hypothetical protein [Streptomyces sp. NPDC050548]|uniref:hypothetical protein n=1 Tax=Streptomyces sp. NPDC050548 TaxID=3365629 RepID=UPI003789FB4A
MTMWQRTAPALPAVFATTVLFINIRTGMPRPGGLLGLATFWILLLTVKTVFPPRFGITLTPSAAVVHNLRRRTIPWSDVRGIHTESIRRTTTIVLYEANGRFTRLRAPSTGFHGRDRHFEEKFHVIENWWLTHRGPDWSPVSAPPARNQVTPPA